MCFDVFKEFQHKIGDDKYLRVISGYIKSLSDERAAHCFTVYLLDKNYSAMLLRRVLEIQEKPLLDNLVYKLISTLEDASTYNQKQTICAHIYKIIILCGFDVQAEIIRYFLKSKDFYMRKYGYKYKNLLKLNLLDIAWSAVGTHPKDAGLFINLIISSNDEETIQKHIGFIFEYSEIDEYQVRRLFGAISEPTKQQWAWLKKYSRTSYLYISTIKKRAMSDEECFEIYLYFRGESIFNPLDQAPDKGLFFWCMGHMNKWKVIETLLN